MAGRDLIVRIDGNASGLISSMAAADKATLRYSYSLKKAQQAQLEYDATVAKFGASSKEATAAQVRLGAALARTTEAETRMAVATARAGEVSEASSLKAARAAESSAAAQAAASAKASAAAQAAAAKQAAALRTVGTVAGTIGTAAAVGLGLAAKAAADFNAKMAQVASLSKASASQVQALSEATKGFADLGISATEAADAEIELVKAGLSVQDILGGALRGALVLAADGQMQVGEATQIAAAAMTAFQLAGKDVPHIVDLLAAGADKALGSVSDLGEGLKYAALPAHQLGVSVDDTVATLAEFAQAGLIGSQGGTALQMMFQRLIKPTAQAQDLLDKYNITLYDSHGAFVGMANLAGQLHDKLGGLTLAQRETAIATIFSARAARGATILYQDGAKGAAEWARKVQDSGFAAEQARGKMDSLQGDLQKLGAQFTNDAIDIGQKLQPALREVTQDLTGFLRVVDKVPDPIKAAGVEMAVTAAALGLGVFAFTRLKTAATGFARTLGFVVAAEVAEGEATAAMSAKMFLAANRMQLMRTAGVGLALALSQIHTNSEAGKALKDIGTGAALGTAVLPGFGTALGAAAGAIYAVGSASGKTTLNVDDLTASLDKTTGAATKASQAIALQKAADLSPILDKIGVSLNTYTKALLGNKQAMGAVLIAAERLGPAAFLVVDPMDKAAHAAEDYRQKLAALAHDQALVALQTHPFQASLAQSAKVSAQLGGSMGDLGARLQASVAPTNAAADAEENLAAQASKAFAAMFKLDNQVLGRSGDWLNYKAAIDATTQGLKDNGKTLDANSEKGRANAALLNSEAAAALQVASDMKQGSAEQIRYLQNARQELYKHAIAFGDDAKAAHKYVDAVLGIPDQKITKAILDKAKADADIKALQHAYGLTPRQIATAIQTPGLDTAIGRMYALKHAEDALYDKSITITTVQRFVGGGSTGSFTGGHVIGNAQGDIVRGPGTGTSDSILRRVSKGEAITRAAIVAREGEGNFRALNAGKATIVPIQGMAGGGIQRSRWNDSYGLSQARTVTVGGTTQTVVVQAPAGPQKITLDIGGGQTLTGVMTAVAAGQNSADWQHNGMHRRMGVKKP